MAFVDKIGKMANRVTEVAGETFDYSKTKGKIVLEKGKKSEATEALGAYVHETISVEKELDMETIKALCEKIDVHIKTIEKLEEDARRSGEELTNGFK